MRIIVDEACEGTVNICEQEELAQRLIAMTTERGDTSEAALAVLGDLRTMWRAIRGHDFTSEQYTHLETAFHNILARWAALRRCEAHQEVPDTHVPDLQGSFRETLQRVCANQGADIPVPPELRQIFSRVPPYAIAGVQARIWLQYANAFTDVADVQSRQHHERAADWYRRMLVRIAYDGLQGVDGEQPASLPDPHDHDRPPLF